MRVNAASSRDRVAWLEGAAAFDPLAHGGRSSRAGHEAGIRDELPAVCDVTGTEPGDASYVEKDEAEREAP